MFDKIMSSIASKANVNHANVALGCVSVVAQTVLMTEVAKYTQVVTNAAIDFDPERNMKISNLMQQQIDELKALEEKNKSK